MFQVNSFKNKEVITISAKHEFVQKSLAPPSQNGCQKKTKSVKNKITPVCNSLNVSKCTDKLWSKLKISQQHFYFLLGDLKWIYPTSVDTLYSASHFGRDSQVSRLLLKIKPCCFHVPVLLFCETQDGINRFCITFFVYKIQGDFENSHFLYYFYIYEVISDNVELRTVFNREFCAESSGVLKFFFRGMVLEIRPKLIIFLMEHPVFY